MIELSVAGDRMPGIETTGVSLRGGRPVINGAALEPGRCEVHHDDDDTVELRYSSPSLQGGSFGLRILREGGGARLWLSYWVDGLPPDFVLDSFGLRFTEIANLRQYLRNGYFSWDGSYYVQPDALADLSDPPASETGYAMCQLLPRSGQDALILGFDRHDRFQQTFTFDTRREAVSLTIETLWDRKDRSALARCESERLVIFQNPEIENGLREWARHVAAAAPQPPRLPSTPITGWCSWYNLYASIDEENVLEHLRAAEDVARREGLPMRVFQIDDGFTPEMGDWLDIKPQFPRGIRHLLEDIRAAGFLPGLWIAPFMVGNRSRLFRAHPDWVVKDGQSGEPLAHMRFYGEFRWHKRSEEYYILDTTHPDAFEYLRTVFRTWRRDWGCEYFKTDFMHFGSEHGPDRAVWHRSGLTRIEIWRRTADMIRQEIGDAVWLGCGCPLWASVGLVDAVRIGRDVGVAWKGDLSAQSLLRDQACRNFANQILWQADPDCVLLRHRFHELSEEELKSLAILAGMSGGVMMTSDHLGELSEDRLRLWRLILPHEKVTCDFPLLGQSAISYERSVDGGRHVPRAEDPVIVQVRQPQTRGGTGALFILNASNRVVERTYALDDLRIENPVYLHRWGQQNEEGPSRTGISVTLPAHSGALFFFSRQPILDPPARLPAR